MLRKILLILAIVLIAFAVFIQSRPAAFSVQRSATMAAAPEKIFPHLNDFHLWDAWSPWNELDAQMQKTYSGSPSGVGAVYEWKGNDDVGSGRMTVTEAVPNEKVAIRLEFFKPMEATNPTTFTIVPQGAQSTVTWRMEGQNGFIGKAFSVFVDMDAMVGKDFDKGLAKLKAVVEKP
jgi:hypothetical protein